MNWISFQFSSLRWLMISSIMDLLIHITSTSKLILQQFIMVNKKFLPRKISIISIILLTISYLLILLKLIDKAVLENYHIAETFKVLKNPNCDIFEYLSSEEYRIVRKRIIEGILHTDMEAHARNLTLLKNKLEALDIKKGLNLNKLIDSNDVNYVFENQQLILGYALHSCDISGNTKDIKISLKWKDLIFEEFFAQGDIEKKAGSSVTILCDRETTKINHSQIGFINYIVKPTFDLLLNIFPEVYPLMNNLKINLRNFQKLVKQEDEKQGSTNK